MMKHIKTDNCLNAAATVIFSCTTLSPPNLYCSCNLTERQGGHSMGRCDEHGLAESDWWSFVWLTLNTKSERRGSKTLNHCEYPEFTVLNTMFIDLRPDAIISR